LILVDTGPLVATIDAHDTYHDVCADLVAHLQPPMITTWPVITEAMHFLGLSFELRDTLWEAVERGTVQIADLDSDDRSRMRYLMRKYRDLPMDVADASLVALAEREHINRIFTIDRRDFSIYKPAGMKRFEIIP
jgi:uncharacterized protein